MKNFKLEIVVFLCGAGIMILELTGSRLLAPYVGTSIFVWTSLIGIILGSLSLGYWWGGRLSDQKPQTSYLAAIIFFAGLWIGVLAFVHDFAVLVLESKIQDIRVCAVAASLLLFSVPSILLGMVSPYAVRLKITSVQDAGETAGALFALSTIGSIAGTFLTGFVLLAYFSTIQILIVLAMILMAASWVMYFRFRTGKTIAIILLGMGLFAADSWGAFLGGPNLIDINTPYNRVWIVTSKSSNLRMMYLNSGYSSAIYLDSDEPVFPYMKRYRLSGYFQPNIRKALLIGGAGFTYVRDFRKQFPEALLDVVEIDPALKGLAEKYFRLQVDPKTKIIHEDGRIFLNRTKEHYDVIYGDAFRSIYTIPYHLTTVEAVRRMYEVLNEEGVVLVNVISAIEGEKGEFLRAQYATFKKVFPQVYVIPVSLPEDPLIPQNILLVALKSEKIPSFVSRDSQWQKYLGQRWQKPVFADMPVLTDGFAPVDQYASKMIPQSFKHENPRAVRLQKLLTGHFRQ